MSATFSTSSFGRCKLLLLLCSCAGQRVVFLVACILSVTTRTYSLRNDPSLCCGIAMTHLMIFLTLFAGSAIRFSAHNLKVLASRARRMNPLFYESILVLVRTNLFGINTLTEVVFRVLTCWNKPAEILLTTVNSSRHSLYSLQTTRPRT
jgi:hypothetical protein